MTLSKRDFLAHSAALAAAGLAPWVATGPASAAAQAASKRVKSAAAGPAADLIVIGAGAAGIPAAIFAAQRGAKVIVLEKAPEPGGTVPRSSGQIAASRTVFQQALGIEDSPQDHYDDIMRINSNTADPVLTRLFVNEAPTTLNWLAANGFKVLDGHPVLTGGHEPFTKRRYQWGAESGRSLSKVLLPMLQSAANSGRVQLLANTGAVELIQDRNGTVQGVIAEDAAGARHDLRARAVLIASGGCAANARLFEELHGVRLATTIAYPFSQGNGLLLGMGAGGWLRGGEHYVPLYGALLASEAMPSAIDAAFRSNPLDRLPWEIHVNARGERFVREDHTGIEYRQHALQRQPGHRLWVIADRKTLDQAPSNFVRWSAAELLDKCAVHPMCHRAHDLATLALKAGIDPSGLKRSVTDYNDALRSGRTDAFGREHRPVAIEQPPFVAVRMTGWTVVSFAGLAVDGELRVIRPGGAPIPNLYAAGEVLGGGATSGNAYTNGTMLTPALTFGRLLGERLSQRQT